MESVYSVGTSNRYAAFMDDEDDPGDIISPPEKETPTTKTSKVKETGKQIKSSKGKENKDKAAQKQNKVVVLENVNKTASQDKSNSAGRQKQGGAGRGERGERQGGDREKVDNRRQNEDRSARPARGFGRPRLSSKEKDRENDFGGGEDRPNRGRGQRPFRERGGGRGGSFRAGKREFERRSGSDKSSIKPVDKRDGGGAHNWGRQEDGVVDDWPNEEPEAQLDTQEPVANGEGVQEQKEQAEGQEGAGEGEEPVSKEEEEEEEPKEMTLDEYKAKQSQEFLRPDLSLQRNVDNSQWKGTVALKKEDEEFFPGTREVIEKPKTSGRVKTTLDPNFYFKDPARRGRGRMSGPGGRGGGPPRDDRGAGGGMGGRRPFDENRREGGGRGGGRRDFEGGRREFEGGRREFEGGRREFEGGRREFEGGRREFEGGRREFGRGGRGRSNRRDRAPNVEDESDFPSLGAN